MSWFHTNLRELRKTLSEIESKPSPENINRFHSEVAEKLEVLKSELKHTQFLMSSGQLISEKLNRIEAIFEDMIFLKGDVENQPQKALQREMQRFSEGIEKISGELNEIRRQITPLERVVELVKIEEKTEEE